MLNEEKEEEPSGRDVHSVCKEFGESQAGSTTKRKDEGTVWLEARGLKKVLRNTAMEIHSGKYFKQGLKSQFTDLGLTQ